jgi:hypothetical protein
MCPFNARLFCTVAFAAGMPAALTAGVELRRAPDIAPARHLRFTPQPGTAWYLDGSTDGQTWNQLAGPVFANGGAVDLFRPATELGVKYQLRYVDPAAVGHAPVTVAGTSLVMEKSGGPTEVVFMDALRGFLRIDAEHARGFTYLWKKKSPDEAEAILHGLDGTMTLLRLKFMDAGLGRWGMEDIPSEAAAALVGETLDAGAFTFRKGRFTRGSKRAQLPLDLAGGSMVLNEGGHLTHVNFTGATAAVLLTEDGNSTLASYAYDPEDDVRGRLHLTPLTGPSMDLGLNLKAAGAGDFNDFVPPAGQSPRSGTFTLPEDQQPPNDPDCPPEDLAGLSLIINDSSPCTLYFNAGGTGVQTKEINGALQVMRFSYTYSRTGGNSASVAITYPGAQSDLIDDYDMDFDDDCTGSFQRDSYADGNSTASTGGTFGPGGGAAGGFPGAALGPGF